MAELFSSIFDQSILVILLEGQKSREDRQSTTINRAAWQPIFLRGLCQCQTDSSGTANKAGFAGLFLRVII